MSGRDNVSKRHDVQKFACRLQLTVVFIPISFCFLLANLRSRLIRQFDPESVSWTYQKLAVYRQKPRFDTSTIA